MVGDMFLLTAVAEKTKTEYRAYFTPFPDPELGGRIWPARIRANAAATAAMQKQNPKGYIVLDNEIDPMFRKGVTQLFELRDSVIQDTTSALKARYKDIGQGKTKT